MILRSLMFGVLSVCLPFSIAAADVSEEVREVRADIVSATKALSDQRAEHSASRAPVVKALRGLEREVRGLEDALKNAGGTAIEQRLETRALRDEVAGMERELDAVAALLVEYRRSVETRMDVASLQRNREALDAIDKGLAESGGPVRTSGQGPILTFANTTVPRVFDEDGFAGTCIGSDGVEQSGRFVRFGPAVYFAAADSGLAGMVAGGDLMPRIHDASPAGFAAAIHDLVSVGTSVVPVDLTGGDAMKVVASRLSLVERLQKGGYTMIPLLAIAALALVLVVWKTVALAGVRSREPELVSRVVGAIRSGDTASASDAASDSGAILQPILQAGVSYAHVRREALQEIMHERMLAVVPTLDKHLSTLAVLGGVAPLLGLLGTVTGMVHTFNLVTIFGSGNPGLLSGGISEALITTMVGLIIAIPVLLAHAYLVRRVRTVVSNLEQTIVHFINQVSIEENGDG